MAGGKEGGGGWHGLIPVNQVLSPFLYFYSICSPDYKQGSSWVFREIDSAWTGWFALLSLIWRRVLSTRKCICAVGLNLLIRNLFKILSNVQIGNHNLDSIMQAHSFSRSTKKKNFSHRLHKSSSSIRAMWTSTHAAHVDRLEFCHLQRERDLPDRNVLISFSIKLEKVADLAEIPHATFVLARCYHRRFKFDFCLSLFSKQCCCWRKKSFVSWNSSVISSLIFSFSFFFFLLLQHVLFVIFSESHRSCQRHIVGQTQLSSRCFSECAWGWEIHLSTGWALWWWIYVFQRREDFCDVYWLYSSFVARKLRKK